MTGAVIITLADNGFNESDSSNLENSLYLHFKRCKNVIVHNLTVPSCCKSYDVEDSSVLAWTDKIVNSVMDYVFGESRTDYALKEHSEHTYDFVRTGRSNFSIERVPSRTTFTIMKGSIWCLNDKMDGKMKERCMQLIKDNKFVTLMDELTQDGDTFYRFEESLKLKTERFELFFKRMHFQYFINGKGETHKLVV